MAAWQMRTSSEWGAGYYHGADLVAVEYGPTKEEAMDRLEKFMDTLTQQKDGDN